MEQNIAGNHVRHSSESQIYPRNFNGSQRRLTICLWSVALLAVLALPSTAHATPRCEIYVTVENVAGVAGHQFTVDWQHSKFRGSGFWHAICGRNGRPACQHNQSKIKPRQDAEESFKSVTGGCNEIRTVKIQLDRGSKSESAVCAVPATHGGSQHVTIDAKWPDSGLSYTCSAGQ